MFNHKKFCERLRSLRQARNITCEHLGMELGATKQTVSQYETGYRRPPYETLIAIAKYYKVSTDYLLGIAKKTTESQ